VLEEDFFFPFSLVKRAHSLKRQEGKGRTVGGNEREAEIFGMNVVD
jgi:hypothetical protein